jgi:hypothetical protein
MFASSPSKFPSVIVLFAAGAVLLGTAGADAKDPPRFRPGLWQFDRTLEVNGKETDRRLTSNLLIKPRETRCVDPTAAVKVASRPIFMGNCRVTRSQPNDNEYVTLTYCGRGDPVKTELKVESDTAYTEISEGKIGASTTKDIVVAKRIGDCRQAR